VPSKGRCAVVARLACARALFETLHVRNEQERDGWRAAGGGSLCGVVWVGWCMLWRLLRSCSFGAPLC
jgi:hypothetical protein